MKSPNTPSTRRLLIVNLPRNDPKMGACGMSGVGSSSSENSQFMSLMSSNFGKSLRMTTRAG